MVVVLWMLKITFTIGFLFNINLLKLQCQKLLFGVGTILTLAILKLGLLFLFLLSSFGLLLFGPKSLINIHILIVVIIVNRYQIWVLLQHLVIVCISHWVLKNLVGTVASGHLAVLFLLRLVIILLKVMGNGHTNLPLYAFACYHALLLGHTV